MHPINIYRIEEHRKRFSSVAKRGLFIVRGPTKAVAMDKRRSKKLQDH